MAQKNEMKNTFDVMNSRLEDAKEWINDLEDKVMESKQNEQKRKKNYEKLE